MGAATSPGLCSRREDRRRDTELCRPAWKELVPVRASCSCHQPTELQLSLLQSLWAQPPSLGVLCGSGSKLGPQGASPASSPLLPGRAFPPLQPGLAHSRGEVLPPAASPAAAALGRCCPDTAEPPPLCLQLGRPHFLLSPVLFGRRNELSTVPPKSCLQPARWSWAAWWQGALLGMLALQHSSLPWGRGLWGEAALSAAAHHPAFGRPCPFPPFSVG